MADSATPTPCPECKAIADKVMSALAVAADPYDWYAENGGKGRRISQLDHDIDKPYYARSRQAAIDEAHKRGLTVRKV